MLTLQLKGEFFTDPADDGIEVAVINLFTVWPDGRIGVHMPGAKTPLEYYKNRSLGPRR